MKILLDVSPYLRGPFTGIGLCAYRCSNAILEKWKELKSPNYEIEIVHRGRSAIEAESDIKQMSLASRFLGSRHEIYHCFEMRLPSAIRSKKIIAIHDLWTLRKNSFQSEDFQNQQRAKIIRAIERADWIVTASSYVQNELIALYPKLKNSSSTIPWGSMIDSDKPPQLEVPVQLRKDLKDFLKSTSLFFLVNACLENRKNQKWLIQKILKFPNYKCVFVGGKGFGYESIQPLILQHPQQFAHFTGISSEELMYLYRSCRALILPSLEEGFGIPVVEALKLSVPLILSRIPPFEEIAGDTAKYFDPLGNGEDLLAIIKNLVENPKIPTAIESVEVSKKLEKFLWPNIAGQYLDIYQKLTTR